MGERLLGRPCPLNIFSCKGPIILSGDDASRILGPFYIEGAGTLVCGLSFNSDMTGTAARCQQTKIQPNLGQEPGDSLDIGV